MEKKFWCCLAEETMRVFSDKYFTLKDAATEAARLAKQPRNEGKKFYIMEATQYCVTEYPPVVGHNMEEGGE